MEIRINYIGSIYIFTNRVRLVLADYFVGLRSSNPGQNSLEILNPGRPEPKTRAPEAVVFTDNVAGKTRFSKLGFRSD